MIRRLAAVVLALTLTPAVVRAQDTVLTITAPSADVYKAPSNVTPIVGHVSHGAVVPVSRNLGSWVKVAWPPAPDGVGYIHVTMGTLTPATGAAPAASPAPRPAAAVSPATTAPPLRTPTTATHVVARRPVNTTPESHLLGVGGLVGAMSTFGASARAWRTDRFGFQVAITRDAMSNEAVGGRVTAMQVEPGVVYGLLDHVSDYVWLRPYVGAAASLRRETLQFPSPSQVEATAESGLGFRLFGGTELTFASAPKFGVSLDVGYRRVPTPFPGFEADRVSAAIAGHWYVR